jgi:hypothetical protein
MKTTKLIVAEKWSLFVLYEIHYILWDNMAEFLNFGRSWYIWGGHFLITVPQWLRDSTNRQLYLPSCAKKRYYSCKSAYFYTQKIPKCRAPLIICAHTRLSSFLSTISVCSLSHSCLCSVCQLSCSVGLSQAPRPWCCAIDPPRPTLAGPPTTHAHRLPCAQIDGLASLLRSEIVKMKNYIYNGKYCTTRPISITKIHKIIITVLWDHDAV